MICIIQARLDSKRLYGKVLKKIQNRPILKIISLRLSKLKTIDNIVIATTKRKIDNKISEFCLKNNIKCFRGSLNNVLQRYVDCANFFCENDIIRITGDSPLVDIRILKKMIDIYNSKKYDLVTNVFPRTFPSGQSVEIVSSKTFMGINQEKLSNYDKEHVTSFFYKHAENFRIYNFKCNYSHKGIKLSIDTHEDLKRVEKIINNDLKNPEDYLIQDLIQG